jgi:cyclohexadieny/prephenate dehydrogenase
MFAQITIIGLGLIGSSIARAVKEYQLAEFIVGCDSSDNTLTYARSHNYIDTAVRDPALAVSGSDMIILAVPPSAIGTIVKKISPKLQPRTIVMDTSSVKQYVIEAVAPYLPLDVDFVPAHPVAGSEQSGGSAGRNDMFQRRRVIITPGEPLSSDVMQAITQFWVGMGARVEGMPAPMHDQIYAYISHLPHLLAFAARNIINVPHTATDDPMLQKFLRLSGSRASLWSEIFFYNRTNLIDGLDQYLVALHQIEQELSFAPHKEEATFNDTLARTVLFPHIAASCLVAAVIEAEKRANLSFARYAGRGFADFTAPATVPPERHLEHISHQHAVVVSILKEYIACLMSWRKMLVGNQFSELQRELVPQKV